MATKPADRKRRKVSGTQKAKKGRKPKLDLDVLMTKIINLVVRHHPSDLSFSRISQLTGVPRPTLYYYFGNSLENLLDEAAQFGMKAIVLLNHFESESLEPDWNSFQKNRLKQVLLITRKYPWAPTLYFRFRNDNTFIGKSVRRLEEEYCHKMADAWAHYHKSKPDMRAVRLSSYVKLGLLFGVSVETELWFEQEVGNVGSGGESPHFTKLVEKMNAVVTEILGERF